MNIAIIGSRSLSDYTLIEKTLLEFINNEHPETIKIISGGAVGTDTLGKQFAEKYNYDHLEFLPDWKKFGRGAGIRRNTTIIENSDVVFAFWDMKSKGTADSIAKARKFGKKIVIIDIHHEQNEHKKRAENER